MEFINQVEAYIFNLFKDKLTEEYIYHDYLHTLRVVQALTQLATGENISAQDTLHLQVAGWFHDAGYIYGEENHEEKSVKIFEEFLSNYPQPNIDAATIKRLILATKYNHTPNDFLEMCMKDADFYHFTLDNYTEHCNLLKEEVQAVKDIEIGEKEWCLENLNFLTKEHYFYTDYAKNHWQPKKEKTIFKLYEYLNKLNSTKKSTNKELKEKKLEKLERPERGIDTLFRVTLNNHTQLSAIADSKANILLSVNSIIISITLTAIIPKLDSASNSHLIIPTFILLIFSVITIVFTIMSTKPKVSSSNITQEDITSRRANILFFGNFHQLELNDFNNAMNDLMGDRKHLYDTLIKDLYYLGLVLNKKYKMLSIAYSVFMFGIIISVSAFCWAFINL